MKAMVYLEDGSVYVGKAIGKVGTSIGEIVFKTSITRNQGILTDPSSAGKIINITFPIFGDNGLIWSDKKREEVHAKGFIAKLISLKSSNCTSEANLHDMLKRMEIVGICGVDTGSITKKIRRKGTMQCVITSDQLSIGDLEALMLMEKSNKKIITSAVFMKKDVVI